MQTGKLGRRAVLMLMTAVFVSVADGARAGEAPLPLDLTRFYHTNFFHEKYKGPGESIPKGAKKIDGIGFQLIGQLGLMGKTLEARGTKYRDEVKGITVERKLDELHLVHHAFWSVEDGVPIALARLWYADGTSNDFPIVYGGHVRDWFRLKYEEKQSVTNKDTKIWWRGTHASAAKLTGSMRLYKTTFTNPHPDKVVKTLDFLSTRSPASYCLIAATVSDADPKRKVDPPIDSGEPDRKFDGELKIMVSDAGNDSALPEVMLDVNVFDDTGGYPLSVYFTGDHGEKVIRYPTGKLNSISLSAKLEGYANTSARLDKPPFPAEYRLKLKPAISLGGLVKDEDGQPVVGASVSVYSTGPYRPDDANRVSVSGTTKTDPAGIWILKTIPAGVTNLGFSVRHTNFPDASFMTDGADKRMITTEPRTHLRELLEKTAVFVLKRGITVKGVVQDPEGMPVKGAKITFSRYPGMMEDKPAKTDEEGKFTARNLTASHKYLLVDADGFATYKQVVTPARDAEPMLIKLEKGQAVKGRVTDKEGKPIEGADIAIGNDNGFNSSGKKWSGKSDAEGRFSWTGAGEEGVQILISKKGYTKLNTHIRPEEGETTFKLQAAGIVKGTVTDAETKVPIAGAKVIAGTSWSESHYNWHSPGVTTDTDGTYTITLDQDSHSDQVLKVEADGYDPGLSQPFPNAEGEQKSDFALLKGGLIKGSVVYTTGQPVSGAQVATVTMSGTVGLGPDGFSSYSSTKTAHTDEQGKFELKLQADTAMVIVSHSNGNARVTLAEVTANPVIVLQSFGRIEGLVLADGQPRTNVSIMLSPPRNTPGLQYDFNSFKATTDAQGKFVLEKVPAGEQTLTRLKQTSDHSWRHMNTTPVTVKPGETTTVVMGAEGSRSVSGRAVLDQPGVQIKWSSAYGSLSTSMPKSPGPFQSSEEARAWSRSPEYKAAIKNMRHFQADFSDDGSFRVDEVEPGTYSLSIQAYDKDEDIYGFSGMRQPVASYTTTVTVTADGPTRQNLGTVQLNPVQPGASKKKTAP